ncbi:hypothetical protein ACHWQZ_G002323 [Mnemiopsis leidyi]
MTSTQGFYKLKGIKERSNRLEDCVKKQNGYQERRLNKYLVCIKKEHEGNMDKFEAEERELIRRNCFLSEYLQKEQERKEQEEIERKERIRNQKTIGLPSIDDSMKNLKEGKSLAPKYGRIFEAPAKLQRRGSVNLQLLHVVGSTSPLPTSRYYHSGSDDSRPSSAGVRLPPLREELSTNNRR